MKTTRNQSSQLLILHSTSFPYFQWTHDSHQRFSLLLQPQDPDPHNPQTPQASPTPADKCCSRASNFSDLEGRLQQVDGQEKEKNAKVTCEMLERLKFFCIPKKKSYTFPENKRMSVQKGRTLSREYNLPTIDFQ